ncbi:hypothetical protein ABVK25_011344 [Lepraria finkii]|uniref:Cupin 2 conserved barrel domain-containing protein n=1 Tax=Lepraria finkii TaxID=1340010 RepID=A0ABR4AT31_9LECA
MSSPKIITTGHNAEGLSIFINNPQCKNFSPSVGMHYSTGSSVPIDLNKNADIAFETRDYSGLIPKQGSGVLILEWPPGADGLAKIHRTMSVDVGVMMMGIERHLDSSETRLIKQSDVLQRGAMHAWKNPSATEPARMLCFDLPSQPVEGAKEKA